MRRTIEMILMALVIVLAAVFVCTTLSGCSSSDDNIELPGKGVTAKTLPLVGKWVTEASYNAVYGLIFTAGGEVKTWQSFPTPYTEAHFGYFFEGTDGEIIIKYESLDPQPDELYYRVVSLSGEKLVIRVFGGLAGTSFEQGTDHTYIRDH